MLISRSSELEALRESRSEAIVSAPTDDGRVVICFGGGSDALAAAEGANFEALGLFPVTLFREVLEPDEARCAAAERCDTTNAAEAPIFNGFDERVVTDVDVCFDGGSDALAAADFDAAAEGADFEALGVLPVALCGEELEFDEAFCTSERSCESAPSLAKGVETVVFVAAAGFEDFCEGTDEEALGCLTIGLIRFEAADFDEELLALFGALLAIAFNRDDFRVAALAFGDTRADPREGPFTSIFPLLEILKAFVRLRAKVEPRVLFGAGGDFRRGERLRP